MFDFGLTSAIVVTFLIAGTVKGVIGLGLPTVSLALLAVLFDLPTAMVLLLVPSFVTNLWQALVGGNIFPIVRRLWPFLAMAAVSVWLGTQMFLQIDPLYLTGLLGGLLMAYSLISLMGIKVSVSTRNQVWAGPLFGTVNGLLTGMTGSFVVPGVLYLQALGLDRNTLIQSMGMLFTASTLALGVSLQDGQLLSWDLAQMSAIGLIPALVGMVAGQKVRQLFSETQFRHIFFLSLLAMGGYIFLNALWNYFTL